jgi:hypothetical protein
MTEWGETPQERVLDHLYESADKFDGFKHEIYGVTENRPEAVMYIMDSDGTCWEITAKEHKHDVDTYDSEL